MATAAWLTACFPTVQLGSHEREATTGGDVASGGAETAEASTSLPPAQASSTSDAEGGQSGTSGAADGTSSSSGPGGATSLDDAASTGTAGDVCAVDPRDDPCLQCARASCCDELELCSGQLECTCFLDCLQSTQDAMECQGQCDPSSGMAAMSVCLAMACPGLCE